LIIKSIHNGDVLHKDISTENIERYKFQGPELKEDNKINVNTLRTGDADLRFYITTVQDG